ncbi:MAG: HAD family hydrolase [Chloroflexi bacterium]|nr:MAG: HAD family hydrolase [Chloroflexota bacterium]
MKLFPALFLDRDGVIIENRTHYVRNWEDVSFFPQALTALARIRHVPYKIILVTNQSVVGRGIISLAEAEAINEQIRAEVMAQNGRIDAIYMCPHAPHDLCACRKPHPGLLLQAAQSHQIDLSQSIMIGDALTDIMAGQAAGVRETILLRTGRGNAQLQLPEARLLPPFSVYDDLHTALQALFPDADW